MCRPISRHLLNCAGHCQKIISAVKSQFSFFVSGESCPHGDFQENRFV